jgi:hypothetical protein
MTSEDAIGEMPCPWCKRPAEIHNFAVRVKLDAAGGDGKAAYPRKVVVVCPPVAGYRGCGTTLANSREAQGRIMETAHVFGAGQSARVADKVAPAAAALVVVPPPVVVNNRPSPAAESRLFKIFG